MPPSLKKSPPLLEAGRVLWEVVSTFKVGARGRRSDRLTSSGLKVLRNKPLSNSIRATDILLNAELCLNSVVVLLTEMTGGRLT